MRDESWLLSLGEQKEAKPLNLQNTRTRLKSGAYIPLNNNQNTL